METVLALLGLEWLLIELYEWEYAESSEVFESFD
jgi:hypothetical protein